jgi:glycerol-3-phosphate dehydrogenase (NAD(P)+)
MPGKKILKCAVIGGGSWGTALAAHLSRLGHAVRLWVLEPEVAEEINEEHSNKLFLPGVEIPAAVKATNALDGALEGVEVLVSVVPSQFVRSVVRKMKDFVPDDLLIISATKGIEIDSLAPMSRVFLEELGGQKSRRFVALAGPSFAKEVARLHPTAVVVAAENTADAVSVQQALSSDYFRIYTTGDLVGVEVCGAVKNVIAIASGILTGLGFGDNTKAALITRGLAEIARLVMSLGGLRRTVAGLAGVGDMVLTCTSTTSRNFTLGLRLGKGESLEEITASTAMIAEGVKTTRSVTALAKRLGLEMPISEAVHAILYEGLQPREAVRLLMTRELKDEWETVTGGLQ